MTDLIILTVPEDISVRARQIAETIAQPEEHAELEKLVERGDRLMLWKAEAAALLRKRGYTFTQKNFLAKHG